MKRIIALILVLVLVFTFTACTGETSDLASDEKPSPSEKLAGEESPSTVAESEQGRTETEMVPYSGITVAEIGVEYDEDDLDSSTDVVVMSYIMLEGDSITLEGSGVFVEGNIVTITTTGTFSISGTLYNGQIIVNTGDEESVRLILNGVDITCATSSPIYVINAEKTVLTLAEGSDNFITDGDSYVFEDTEKDEPDAASSARMTLQSTAAAR